MWCSALVGQIFVGTSLSAADAMDELVCICGPEAEDFEKMLHQGYKIIHILDMEVFISPTE